MTVVYMKAALKALWDPVSGKQRRHSWRTWLAHVHASGIEPLRRFANHLATWHLAGAHYRQYAAPLHIDQSKDINTVSR